MKPKKIKRWPYIIFLTLGTAAMLGLKACGFIY